MNAGGKSGSAESGLKELEILVHNFLLALLRLLMHVRTLKKRASHKTFFQKSCTISYTFVIYNWPYFFNSFLFIVTFQLASIKLRLRFLDLSTRLIATEWKTFMHHITCPSKGCLVHQEAWRALDFFSPGNNNGCLSSPAALWIIIVYEIKTEKKTNNVFVICVDKISTSWFVRSNPGTSYR